MRLGTWPGKRFRDRAAPQGFPPKKKIQPGATATLRLAVDLTLAGRFCSRFSGVTTRLKGNLSTLRPLVGDLAKRKRSRMRLQLVLRGDWHGNTGSLVAQDLALLTKVRTLIHEEISLLTVLYFPFRALTALKYQNGYPR